MIELIILLAILSNLMTSDGKDHWPTHYKDLNFAQKLFSVPTKDGGVWK